MKKIHLSLTVLLLTAILSAVLLLSFGCVDKDENLFGKEDSMRLVIAYADGAEEITLELDGLSRDISLIGLLDENDIPYTASDGFLYSVKDFAPDSSKGEYIYIYTSVEADFDVSEYVQSVEYDSITLTSSGFGADKMSIENGCIVYIGMTKW